MADLRIAQTILQQLKAGSQNAIRMMCWAPRNFVGGDNFLQFRVSAMHLDGYVKITLNALDLYDVELKNKKGEVVDTIEGLYFDNLNEAIDRKIEHIEDYSF